MSSRASPGLSQYIRHVELDGLDRAFEFRSDFLVALAPAQNSEHAPFGRRKTATYRPVHSSSPT